MISRDYINIKSHWCEELRHLFLYHNPGFKKLAVLFPGGDGCCDVPLLHYSRKAALLSGCDALSLSYGHIYSHMDLQTGDLDFVIKESADSINKCLERGYESIYFISKSLGTVIAGIVSSILSCTRVKNIFLTPLPDAVPHIVNSNGIVITGTRDKYFTLTDIERISGIPNIKVKIIEGAVHSLEIDDDYRQSIRILNEVSDICSEFVK